MTNNSLRFYSSYHNSTFTNVRRQGDRLALRLMQEGVLSRLASANGRGEAWLWELEGLNGCPGVGSLAQDRILRVGSQVAEKRKK